MKSLFVLSFLFLATNAMALERFKSGDLVELKHLKFEAHVLEEGGRFSDGLAHIYIRHKGKIIAKFKWILGRDDHKFVQDQIRAYNQAIPTLIGYGDRVVRLEVPKSEEVESMLLFRYEGVNDELNESRGHDYKNRYVYVGDRGATPYLGEMADDPELAAEYGDHVVDWDQATAEQKNKTDFSTVIYNAFFKSSGQ